MTVLFFSAWGWYYSRKTVVPVDFGGHILVLAVFAAIYMLCFFLYGTFRISITHTPELFLNQLLSLAITDGIMYILIMLLCAEAVTVLPLAVSLVGQACIALLWSVVTRKWYFATHPPKKTIIIWDVRKGLDKLINMYGVEDRYQVVSVVHIKECIHDLHSHLNGMDAVFLSGIHSRDRNKIIKYCVNNNIDAYVIPRVGDMIISGAKPIYLFNLPVLKLERYCPNVAFIIIKRLGDILVSGLALIVLSPLMLIVAILRCAEDDARTEAPDS